MKLVRRILAMTLAVMSAFTVVNGEDGDEKETSMVCSCTDSTLAPTRASTHETLSDIFNEKIYSRLYTSGIICNYYVTRVFKRSIRKFIRKTSIANNFRYLFRVLDGHAPVRIDLMDEVLDSISADLKDEKAKSFMSKKMSIKWDVVGTRREIDVAGEYGSNYFKDSSVVSLFFRSMNSCVLKNFKRVVNMGKVYELRAVTVYDITRSRYAILYEKYYGKWYCHTYDGVVIEVPESTIDEIGSKCSVSIDLVYKEVK